MTKLGKYEVLAELATGSMGVLYRARDTILDREVALKTILGTGGLDAELKERFYREARASARLHHPNVITVYELGEHEGLVFIALELLSGYDLRQFIARRLPLTAREKIAIMAAVCDGLHHAHQNGITHRDIKPSNIFLTDTNVPKILDFGVARLSASKLTVVGRVLGTPFYMAPEQIMGQPCDARSDLFALGIVTFEFLTFAHPFAGDSIPKRIINDNPDSVIERNPDVPPALDAILRKALARDPDQRYQSAEEFGRALREAARESEPAPPKSRVPEALKPAAPPPVQPNYANTDHKMRAILMALQGFDEAMEQRNLAVAREALTTVEALAKLDDRFATAAKESRTRLQELEASMPPEPPAPAPPRRTSPPAPVPKPVLPEPPPRTSPPASVPPQPAPPAPAARTTMPPAPAASSTDDATSMFHIPDLPVAPPRAPTNPPVPPAAVTEPRPPTTVPPVSRPPVTQPSRTAIIPTVSRPPGTSTVPPRGMPPRPEARASAPPVPNPAPPRPFSGLPSILANLDRKIVMVAGTAAALIVMALLIWLFGKGGKAVLAPAVGTAQIAVAQAALRQAPSDSSDLIVTLKKGDTVNVIRPPRSRSQEWTEVQYVAGKTISPAGAMHTTDLTNWSSAKPDVALYLIEMYAPGPDAGVTELRQYAQNLSSFIQHFTGTPQQAEAKAELDRINAALARAAAPPPAAAKLAAPPKPAPAVDLEAELARAENAWENGDYDQAERLLKRLLQQKPGFPAAQMLLDKVQKAKQLEGTR